MSSGPGSLPFLRVPVGPDARRRRTFTAERTLAAARTVTSTVRVLESLPALRRDDPRRASSFASGVLDLLNTAGCRVMPWEQLPEGDHPVPGAAARWGLPEAGPGLARPA